MSHEFFYVPIIDDWDIKNDLPAIFHLGLGSSIAERFGKASVIWEWPTHVILMGEPRQISQKTLSQYRTLPTYSRSEWPLHLLPKSKRLLGVALCVECVVGSITAHTIQSQRSHHSIVGKIPTERGGRSSLRLDGPRLLSTHIHISMCLHWIQLN